MWAEGRDGELRSRWNRQGLRWAEGRAEDPGGRLLVPEWTLVPLMHLDWGRRSTERTNAWLTMVEKGWAIGNMGGAATQEKTEAGNRNPVSWVWMGDKTTGRYKILPREKVLAERRGGEERPTKETAMRAQWGGGKRRGGAQKAREERRGKNTS